VNKRVSRLAANVPLIQKNLCPLSFVDVPERDYVLGTLGVYEMTRVELLRDVSHGGWWLAELSLSEAEESVSPSP